MKRISIRMTFFLVSSAAWTLTECDQFEQCFKEYGKDFSAFKVCYYFSHENSILIYVNLDTKSYRK